MIKEIQEAVTIPVMAKARIGHFAEAQVLQSLEVDYIDESEVLTPADERNHIDKFAFEVPVRLRRHQPRRGAAPDRRGRGDDPLQGRGRHRQRRRGGPPHARDHRRDQAARARCGPSELAGAAKEHQAPLDVVREVAERGWLPVPLFCAGGIATPADAALMMQLGAEGNFVGSGIFKSADPERRARRSSRRPRTSTTPSGSPPPRSELGEAMPGLEIADAGRRRRPAAGPRCLSRPSPAHRRPRDPGRLRGPRRMLRALGAEAREVRTPGGARRPRRRWSSPAARARRSRWGSSATGLDGADPRPPRGGRPILGTCAGMIVCDARPPRPDRRDRAPQRLRPPAAELRGGPRGRGARRRAAARGLHPRPLGRGARPRASRCSPSSTATRSRSARANVLAVRLPPGADRRLAGCTRSSWR